MKWSDLLNPIRVFRSQLMASLEDYRMKMTCGDTPPPDDEWERYQLASLRIQPDPGDRYRRIRDLRIRGMLSGLAPAFLEVQQTCLLAQRGKRSPYLQPLLAELAAYSRDRKGGWIAVFPTSSPSGSRGN